MNRVFVTLAPHEIQERKNEMAEVVTQLQQARFEHGQAVEEWKDKNKAHLNIIAGLEQRMFMLSDAVRTSQEWQSAQEEIPFGETEPRLQLAPQKKTLGKKRLEPKEDHP